MSNYEEMYLELKNALTLIGENLSHEEVLEIAFKATNERVFWGD